MVYSRLAEAAARLGRQDFASYLDQLERQPDAPEWEDFINALTTNLTAFFRESHHFPILADFARAAAAARYRSGAARPRPERNRIPSPSRWPKRWARASSSTVLATDIDTNVINRARAAVYPPSAWRRWRSRKRFFLKGRGANAGQVRVRPRSRTWCATTP